VAEEAFRAHLDWADVVLVEWCTALAALLTQVDPGDTRVVVRMHSYEAFTLWPHLVDFSRVDAMVFVSDHLRDLAVAAIPGLQQGHAPRMHVIANAMELQRFVRPKRDDARFTLGVIGGSKMVKDPRWAVEVLRELRKRDERYRLLLVRGKLQDPSPAAQEYAAAFQRDLDELEPSGAVQVLGHTDDVPAALENIGVVISSSVRESFHMGLVEAVASGALPVVRDWPFFPGAARSLFPEDWVVDSPAEAARRILALTADAARWSEATRAAAEYVIGRWDWPAVRRDFEELFDYLKP
jgi:glycosyltransferase involved in cell wall biosynthesis